MENKLYNFSYSKEGEMPKVSVLTPLYNTNQKFLKEMIESILNQTFDDFEFILLNDSPDNKEIKEVVLSYKDNRIIYVENEENLGISKSRNKLLELAKGEYIAIFDHDDISLPQRLEKQVNFLDKNPKVGIVGSNFKRFSNSRKSKNPENNLDIKINLVVRGCIMTHSSVMIRKSLLTKNGIKWQEEYSPCEDYMLFAELIDKTMFYNIQEPLLIYRDHENNTSHNQSTIMEDKENIIKNILYKKYPYYASFPSNSSGIYLFGFIPIIKKVKIGNRIKYLLFDKIPILKIII